MPPTSLQVAEYRAQVIRLLSTWASAWYTHVRREYMSYADAGALIASIQSGFWHRWNRSPQHEEWILSILAKDIRPRSSYRPARLHILNAYVADFEHAGCDVQRALDAFANACAFSFVQNDLSAPRQNVAHMLREQRGPLRTRDDVNAFCRDVANIGRRSWWQRIRNFFASHQK